LAEFFTLHFSGSAAAPLDEPPMITCHVQHPFNCDTSY